MVDAKTSLADELSFSELTALCGFRAISCLERFPAFTALKLLGFTEAEFSFENELRQNQGTAVADTSLEYKIPCIKFPHKTTRSLLLYFPLFCGGSKASCFSVASRVDEPLMVFATTLAAA